MKVIRPIKITEAMVQSTTAAEAHPNWVSTTTYALGANVVRGESVYVSIQASNLNKDPLTQPTWWTRQGPSNKMAMFDGQINGATTGLNEIKVVVTPGSIVDSLGFVGLVGEFIRVVIRDGGPTGAIGYDSTQPLSGGESVSWYQYFFFDPFLDRTTALYLDSVPPFSNPWIEVTIWVSGTGPVAIGEANIGRQYYIGQTQYGASAGIIDYSRKESDQFGNVTFVKRAFSKRVDSTVFVRTIDVNRIQRLLYEVRATPLMWIFTDIPAYEEPLVVYGFYRDFTTEITYPSYSQLSIQIEGLI